MANFLVSGASKGIGLELVKKLTSNNLTFAIVRTDEDAFDLVQAVSSDNLVPIVCDLNSSALERDVSATIEEYGGVLNCLINSAGIGGRGSTLIETDPRVVSDLFNNNCLGALRLSKYCAPYLVNSNKSIILNIISRFGLGKTLNSQNMKVSYAYAISKSAMNTLTALLARDPSLAGIISISIDPGPTKTRMGREDAKYSAIEIADKLIALCKNIAIDRYNGRAIDLHSLQHIDY